MTWSDIYLLCFSRGSAVELGNASARRFSPRTFGVGPRWPRPYRACARGHGHAQHGPVKFGRGSASESGSIGWLGAMANPSCVAVYLTWFGGVGYLLTRHSGLIFWLNLLIAVALGLFGAWILATFLRFLQAREQATGSGRLRHDRHLRARIEHDSRAAAWVK